VKDYLKKLNAQRLRSYDADPGLVKEHYGIEQTVLAGGYGYRQILELVQNGADALLEAQEQGMPRGGNRIHVLLSGQRLYVANTGAPLSEEGLDALLRSHSSPKRGSQIGRFGLGFKSLLRLSGRIDVFTRESGAIRFDPERCRSELCQRYKVADAPGMRLAWRLREDERSADATCSKLSWAETIVRAEVGADNLLEHLRQEIRAFPAEFLLFFPLSTALTLDDGEQSVREVGLEVVGDEHLLRDSEDVTRWCVRGREIQITDARARADATHIHARDSVPLVWAMPLEARREETGRFWAFFPTHTHTYVPGILNAPWKLNSDRNAIIAGEWNTALMTEAARLIAESLAVLASAEDPGRPLDAFPRQLERRDEDAAPLVEALWSLLHAAAVIPDGLGALRLAQDVWRPPRDSLALARVWQTLAGTDAKRQFVHSSCLERQRASRLNALAERIKRPQEDTTSPALRRCSTESWFGLVASTKPYRAKKVIRLAESYAAECQHAEWSQVRPRLKIIPVHSDELVTASQALMAPDGITPPGRSSVHSELQVDGEAKRILIEVMQVRELDDDVWASVLLEALRIPQWPRETQDAGWKAFWVRMRRAPARVRKEFLLERADSVKVRRRDGQWVSADRVLLPGGLIEARDCSSNRNVLADEDTHAKDRPSLEALGVKDTPEGDEGPGTYIEIGVGQGLLEAWREACRQKYRYTHRNAASWNYLDPEELTMPRGFSLLAELKGSANARFTHQLLNRLAEPAYQRPVGFGHSTMSVYPKIDVPHPLPWYLLNHGVVQIGSATARLATAMERRSEPALDKLPAWRGFASALDRISAAFPAIAASPADLKDFWCALIRALVTEDALANDTLTDLWIGAAKDGVVPTELPWSAGSIPLRALLATTSADLAHRVRAQGRIVITLDAPTMQLWLKNGAQDLITLIKAEWAAAVGPPELLTSLVPEIVDVLGAEARGTARCQRVTQLRLRIDDATQDTPCLLWDGALHMDQEQLAPLSRAARLRLLLQEVAVAGWLDCRPGEALARLGDARVDEQRARVAQGETLAEKLLFAVGSRREPLLEALGEQLREMNFIQQCAPVQLAELVLAQLGPATLTTLRATLEAEGLKPPVRWNTSGALAFVASLGFPPEFAAAPESRREPEESISGPIELPPLHDFQREVMDGLHRLLSSSGRRRRAVISLPTGGGKTRVTVEAAVRLVLAPEGGNRSVVWIAQTDELCEQAVQAFRQVWVNLGAERTDLRIIRLWGGNPNPPGQELNRPVIVVASIQTLNSRFGAADLEWLRKPGLTVVDECHHAITPSYTALLRWLDAEAPRAGAPGRDEAPIVGLSATPFRTDDDESHRLARRFDNCWLPSDQAQLYTRLRSQGVLARASYEPLQSGTGLTEEELARIGRLPEAWEGLDFENLLEAINQRLASDAPRNERIVECIQASAERSILLFTNSVVHAEEMAARLNLVGIGAAAISGTTPMVARRYFLDRFQRGQISVLCNHSVLSTGFDAPKIEMVLIARQVFSPVRYMQMVGRGLRGEKNGGTASCRIVTVVDNLGRFQDRHPYHYCRQYFLAMEGVPAQDVVRA